MKKVMDLFFIAIEWMCRRNLLWWCGHRHVKGEYEIAILGVEGALVNPPMCPACMVRYYERYHTTCGTCEEPIFPGEAVAQAYRGAAHPYTHMTFECSPCGAFYCGVWDKGRLKSLVELERAKVAG